ncbi:Peptide deformylase [Candidatus Ecksteinia adelgidicola]|nr:Peptide deformylase [Candidatus Ecksteinia adelgidicola]
MSILQMLYYPDKRLRQIAKLVKLVDVDIQNIIDNMFETMYEKEGIGLAATQVNIHQQIIVIDISTSRNQPLTLINPELLYKSGETSISEGCLSIPAYRALIPRFSHVNIYALDRNGKPFELEAEDLLSICIQHEMDHLIGKLFIDYLSSFKRNRIYHKFKKIAKFSTHNFN